VAGGATMALIDRPRGLNFSVRRGMRFTKDMHLSYEVIHMPAFELSLELALISKKIAGDQLTDLDRSGLAEPSYVSDRWPN
jgi:hypothetical protein